MNSYIPIINRPETIARIAPDFDIEMATTRETASEIELAGTRGIASGSQTDIDIVGTKDVDYPCGKSFSADLRDLFIGLLLLTFYFWVIGGTLWLFIYIFFPTYA
jgi:hypothetical protein